MTDQDLKNAILQLAVQGKLVPQDPDDEPVSELLKRIKAEKKQLILEGKLIKEKQLSPITDDEIPFDIPESWEWVKLGDLCVISTGKKDANFGSPNGDYYFFTCAKEPIRCNSFSFSGESILMAGNGDISNISYYVGDFEAYQRTYVVQPFIEQTYLLYLYYHLNSNWVRYNSDKTFGSAIPYIRLGNVQNYLVALPPLAEQQRIVAKIEELMPLVEEYGKAEERLTALNAEFPDKLRKSILQQAIQGKLTERDPADEPASELLKRIRAEKERLIKEGKIKKEKPFAKISEDEIPFEIPDSWKWIKWGDVVNVVSARRVHQSDWKTAGIPFYRAREIGKLADNGIVDNELFISKELFDEFSKSGVPQAGDLMVTAVGTLGKTYIVQPDDKFYYKDASVICLENYGNLCAQYLKCIMQSDMMMNQVRRNSDGTTVATLTMERMIDYLMPLPPLAEQQRIVDRVNELLAMCDELK